MNCYRKLWLEILLLVLKEQLWYRSYNSLCIAYVILSTGKKNIFFPDAIPIRSYSFCHYFPHIWELKTFPLTSPSQHRISHFLWQHTKSIRPALTTKALRMSSRISSAQPIPSYPSIWPEPLLGDCEAVWGPPLDPSPSFFPSCCFPGLLSHFVINVSSSN